MDISVSDKESACVQFHPVPNHPTITQISIFNSNFRLEFITDLGEDYANHRFVTYDFKQLKRVLDDTKIKGVNLVFNENQLLEYTHDKKAETTSIKEHALSYSLPPVTFEELWSINHICFKKMEQVDDAFTIFTSIKNSLELYPELGRVFLYQDAENKFHFNTTNGYSIYDTYLNLDEGNGKYLNGKQYSCDAAYAENLYHFRNYPEIDMVYTQADNEEYGLYISSGEGEYGVADIELYMKINSDTLPFKSKLVLPKDKVYQGEIDLDLKAMKSLIKAVKEDLSSKDQKSFAIVIHVKDGKVYLGEEDTGQMSLLPNLDVNYYDLASFMKTGTDVVIEQDENYTVFKTAHSKMIVKN